jgi:hypothetical protein
MVSSDKQANADKGKHKIDESSLRRSSRERKQTPTFPGMIDTPTKRRGKTKVMPAAIKKALADANLLKKLDEEQLILSPLQQDDSSNIEEFCITKITQQMSTRSSEQENPTLEEVVDHLRGHELCLTDLEQEKSLALDDNPYEDEVDYEPSPDGGV